ncbi:tripartite tricarboxylate transporter permease [Leisingera sp.]|uniref:tripartite tricarboxylate transporter permease n=1 Tax=Leisingera sp. TaxID=1879318 RepID=UPI003A8FE0DA
MIDLAAFMGSIDLLTMSWEPWIVVPLGILIGLGFGMVPGLSIPIAMAVFLPFTLTFDFVTAILFLTAIFTGGTFGTAVPAILMNVPGTAASVATCFDGYPMSQKGQYSRALGIALMASTIGTGFGYVLLFLLIDPISRAVLKLGPPELLVVAIFGLIMIAALSEGHMLKGVITGAIGLLIGTIGISSLGLMRGTFGSPYLLDGIPAVPALIGLFAASELSNLLGKDFLVPDTQRHKVRIADIFAGMIEALRQWRTMLFGGTVGVVIGAIPGVGAAIANLLSYDLTRRVAKDCSTFGKGEPKGLVAAESANSSSEAGSMATLLGLGLPGGGATAVMVGAFAAHNVTGGPRFIADHKDIVYAIIIGNFVQVLLLVAIGVVFLRLCSNLVRVPVRYLVPAVLSLSALGSYALIGNIVGPITLVGATVLGFWMRMHRFPVTPMVIGILLGNMVEGEVLRSYQLGAGSFWYMFTRPVVLGLFAVFALFVTYVSLRRTPEKAPSQELNRIGASQNEL